MLKSLSTLLVLTSMAAGQRPSFAGFRPIGFPDTPNRTTTPDSLGDRFGEGTTERLPIEANGDRDLIDRLSKLPLDKQPFWFINWQALEAHRKNPQTYPQRPNVFVDPVPQSGGVSNNNQGISNANQGFPNPNSGFSNPNTGFINNNGFDNNNNGFSNSGPTNFNNGNAGFSNSNSANVVNRSEAPNFNPVLLSTNSGFKNPNSGVSNHNSGVPNHNSGISNQSSGISNANSDVSTQHSGHSSVTGSSNSNSGFGSNSGVPNVNTRFAGSSGFSSSSTASNRFSEDPSTNSNSYSWNNSYQHASYFAHSYNSSYYVPNETRSTSQQYHN